MHHKFGFSGGNETHDRHIERLSIRAVKKAFSPEFIGRIDVISTYQPLTDEQVSMVFNQQVVALRAHMDRRIQSGSDFEITASAEAFLISKGTSRAYGARDLKRVIHQHLRVALADLIVEGELDRDSRVIFSHVDGNDHLTVTVRDRFAKKATAGK